jgi:hypothetical protein
MPPAEARCHGLMGPPQWESISACGAYGGRRHDQGPSMYYCVGLPGQAEMMRRTAYLPLSVRSALLGTVLL